MKLLRIVLALTIPPIVIIICACFNVVAMAILDAFYHIVDSPWFLPGMILLSGYLLWSIGNSNKRRNRVR